MFHFTPDQVLALRALDKRRIQAIEILFLCEDWLRLYQLLGEAAEREAKLLALVGRIA